MICANKGNIVQIHYNHYLCRKCLRKYLMIMNQGPLFRLDISKCTSRKPISVPIRCPARNCKYHFGMDIIKDTIGPEEFEVKISNEYKNISFPKIKSKVCPWICQKENCGIELSEENSISFDCGHSYCKECIRSEERSVGKECHRL